MGDHDASARRLNRLFNRPLPPPPVDVSDVELENFLVTMGFPRDECYTAYRYTIPHQYRWLRGLALSMYQDSVLEARGDKDAKERLDYVREALQPRQRRDRELEAFETGRVTL
jgi:hypothetical protein